MALDADGTQIGGVPGRAVLSPTDQSTDRIAVDSTAAGSIDGEASFGFGPPTRAAPLVPDLVGDTVGGVRITAIIADGGMGRVYAGVQESPRPAGDPTP